MSQANLASNTLQRAVKDKSFGCAFGASLTALFPCVEPEGADGGGTPTFFSSDKGTLRCNIMPPSPSLDTELVLLPV